MLLRWRHFVPPTPTGLGGTEHWTVTLHPREDSVASKTMRFDDNIPLDSSGFEFVPEWIKQRYESKKQARLLDTPVVEASLISLRQDFDRVVKLMGITADIKAEITTYDLDVANNDGPQP